MDCQFPFYVIQATHARTWTSETKHRSHPCHETRQTDVVVAPSSTPAPPQKNSGLSTSTIYWCAPEKTEEARKKKREKKHLSHQPCDVPGVVVVVREQRPQRVRSVQGRLGVRPQRAPEHSHPAGDLGFSRPHPAGRGTCGKGGCRKSAQQQQRPQQQQQQQWGRRRRQEQGQRARIKSSLEGSGQPRV